MALIDNTQLALETGLTISTVNRYRGVLEQLIERYASDAPDEIKSEVLIRASSYLEDSRPGLAASKLQVGDALTFDYRAVGSALRLSGGSSLLSPWRSRQVGRCEVAE